MPQSASAILTDEVTRLTNKQTSIDNAFEKQQRLVLLNDSYRKRYSRYTQIVATFVLCLLAILILNAISKTFPFIPSILINTIAVVVFVYSVYKIVTLYFEIQSRSKLNFDELDIPPSVDPSMNAPINIQTQSESTATKTDIAGTSRVLSNLRMGFTTLDEANNQPFSNALDTPIGTPISEPVSTSGQKYVESRFIYKGTDGQ